MIFTDDMRDLIKIFNRKRIEYVLIGGFAVNYYGYIRTTQDIDILILPSGENLLKVAEALKEFGFGKEGISRGLFESEGIVVHLGVEPNRIDIFTGLKGVSNSGIFSRRMSIKYQGINLNIISFRDLIKCKKQSNRMKDKADVEELENISKNRRNK